MKKVKCFKCNKKGNAREFTHVFTLSVSDLKHLKELKKNYNGQILNYQEIKKQFNDESKARKQLKKTNFNFHMSDVAYELHITNLMKLQRLIKEKKLKIRGKIWKAKDFKNIGPSGLKIDFKRCIWICKKCFEHTCKRCSIGLSNEWRCRCEVYHGEFYPKHPNYCKKCWDEMKHEKKT